MSPFDGDEFEALLGQLHSAHLLEVQTLREQVRSLQRSNSAQMEVLGDIEDRISKQGSRLSKQGSRLSKQSKQSKQDLDAPGEKVERSGSEEETVDSPTSPISKVWHSAKQRGLNKQKKWRSTSALKWEGHLRPFLAKCIKLPAVDCFMSFLIFCNALVFAVEAQYRGWAFADAASMEQSAGTESEEWLRVGSMFSALELAFGITFTVEVCVRLFAEGLGFWKEFWNCLDFIIIAVWLLEKLVTSLPLNSQILRLGRIFRLLRLLRLVRSIQEFDPLFLMTTAIKSSITVLGWTMALLFICHLLLALVVQQILFGYYFTADAENQEAQQRVFTYFGTFSRSFLSLFELTLANWIPVCRLLVEEVGEWWLIPCLLHKLTVGFAVLGVINAVLMQETFKVAYLDDTVMVREKMRTMKAHVAKMSELFHEADTSGDGTLDLNEFKRILKKHEVKVWLSAMELDVSDAEELFKALDTSGDGRLSADELVNGVSRLRGAGRAQEVRKILETSEHVKRMLADMSRQPSMFSRSFRSETSAPTDQRGADQLTTVSY